MKHHYHVLWFEDNQDIMDEDYKPPLEEFLSEHGFVLHLDHQKDFSTGITFDYGKYDLIVTDLNLGGENTDDAGGGVLSAVRQDQVLTDIIFYSSNPTRLNQILARLGHINRVTLHRGREGLMDTVRAVVQLTIRKSQVISGIRGQFIAEAIDLENKLLDFTNAFLDQKVFPEIAEAKAKQWATFVADRVKSLQKQSKALEEFKLEDGSSLHEQRFFQFFDAFKLAQGGLKHLEKHYSDLAKDGNAEMKAKAAHIVELRNQLGQFSDEVIDVRNILAHVQEVELGGTYVLKSRKSDGHETVIDPAWCIETRKKLRAHHDNLKKLAQLIAPSS